jgi:type I restriction enzyme R subunit
VLKHYTSYATYFKLLKACEDDPNVERKKAAQALARFMKLHPHNIAQKTEVMVEHFQAVTRHKIGGRAKAMVVTGLAPGSRALQAELRSVHPGEGLRHQVAGGLLGHGAGRQARRRQLHRSGHEPRHLGERSCPRSSRRRSIVLLVAEKYQTGFDQPLLHTMFVDKRLAGIQAVQTLSR